MKDSAKGLTGTALTWLLTIEQTNEIFELVQIILATIVSAVTLAYIIYKWYKRATDKNSDGGNKITKDEIEDLGKEITKFKEEQENGNKDKR